MTYFIIMRGPLGVGKSAISEKLAKILGAEHISLDKVLEKHHLDKCDEALGCISPQNFIKADELIVPYVESVLKKGKIVIFDGCFYHREQIDNLLAKLKEYRNYAFTLKAPLDVCIQRDAGRKRVYGDGAAAAVHSLVSRFDYGALIDTSGKTIEATIKEILTHLPR